MTEDPQVAPGIQPIFIFILYILVYVSWQQAPRINISDYGKEGSIDGNDQQMKRMCSLLGNCREIGELAISDSSLDAKRVQSIADAVKYAKVNDCDKLKDTTTATVPCYVKQYWRAKILPSLGERCCKLYASLNKLLSAYLFYPVPSCWRQNMRTRQTAIQECAPSFPLNPRGSF